MPLIDSSERRKSQGKPTDRERVGVVGIWSTNVLPTDPVGSRMKVSFNDPHKYVFCRFLASSPQLSRVSTFIPTFGSHREETLSGENWDLVRIHVASKSLTMALLTYNLRLALEILRHRYKLAYFFNDGKALPFLAPLLAARIRGIATVLDYRNPPAIHVWPRIWNIRSWLVFAVESTAYHLASFVVALSPTCATILAEAYGGNPWVVPSVASAHFYRSPAVVLGRDGTIRFAYWGSMSRARRLDEVVLGFVDASRSDPATPREMVFVGDGDDRQRLEALAREASDTRIVFLNWQPQEALVRILDTVSASVITIPPTIDQYVASSPLKLAEALALGRPIIASDIPATRIVEEFHLGIRTRHNRSAYAEAFRQMDRERLNQCVMSLRSFEGRSQRSVGSDAFAKVIDHVLRASPYSRPGTAWAEF